MNNPLNCIIKSTVIALSLFHAAFAAPEFLTLSDIHYGSKNTSKIGHDTGPEFLNITLNKMRELSKNVDFILFLGDIPTHSFFFDEDKKDYEKKVFHGLYQSDSGSKPMFYIPGNNDSLKGNYGPFESNGISPLTYASDWDGACAHCRGLVIDGSHMRHDGYYSSYVIPDNKGIILIALNATQWTRIPGMKESFVSIYPNQKKDALEQLAWLERQLKNNHAKQLLIAMHEPPGLSYLGEPIWHKLYLKEFVRIISKYKSLYGEISLLTSHTHMEEFRKIKLAPKEFIYAYSTPSISRIHYNHPAIKIFNLTKDMNIENFTTYYTSNLLAWGKQKYHALSTSDAIFPDCKNKILATCLDNLNADKLCNDLYKDSFHGVNPKKQGASCKKTYLINNHTAY